MHGAAGGLGTLALQMLTTWGAKITAIARPPTMAGCLAAGAIEVLDGTKQPFASLGRAFDATLNFATWDDDLALVGCLRDGALGHASTVHPMLGNFDRYGWVRGALKSFSEKRSPRAALPKGTRNYVWTLFRPDATALSELASRLARGITVDGSPLQLIHAGAGWCHFYLILLVSCCAISAMARAATPGSESKPVVTHWTADRRSRRVTAENIDGAPTKRKFWPHRCARFMGKGPSVS